MSGFDADWLALRAPHDAAARRGAAALAAGFAAAAGGHPTLMDLAAGTGNNVRFLAPMLGAGQTWLLVDNDPGLLEAAAGLGTPRRADLATGDLNQLVSGVSGVTTAALLDLVSRPWLARLVTALAGRRLPLLASLSVDGRFEWSPGDPGDAAVMAGFFADLQGDKGFGGAALGTAAAKTLAQLCVAAGYRVETAATDWVLGGGAVELLAAMIDGIANAAAAQGMPEVGPWQKRRHECLNGGDLRLSLGHQDVLAVM